MKNNNYNLNYNLTSSGIELDMSLLGEKTNTKELDNVYKKIISQLPSVLLNKCFNPKKLAFRNEVRETELGHLFEHLLIENMCILKSQTYRDVIFEGKTYW